MPSPLAWFGSYPRVWEGAPHEAATPASAGSLREESAALGVGVGGGALDGEGGARAGKRGWSMTRH